MSNPRWDDYGRCWRRFWYLEYRDLIPLAESVARHYNARCEQKISANELLTALEKAKSENV